MSPRACEILAVICFTAMAPLLLVSMIDVLPAALRIGGILGALLALVTGGLALCGSEDAAF